MGNAAGELWSRGFKDGIFAVAATKGVKVTYLYGSHGGGRVAFQETGGFIINDGSAPGIPMKRG